MDRPAPARFQLPDPHQVAAAAPAELVPYEAAAVLDFARAEKSDATQRAYSSDFALLALRQHPCGNLR